MCSIPAYIQQYHYKMKPLEKEEAKNLVLRNLFGSEKDVDIGLLTKTCVGIEKARDEVIKLIDIDSVDKSCRAIVIEGPNDIGRTTLSNAVFDCLNLGLYNVCRHQIEYSNLKPDINILKEKILRDLFQKDISSNTSMQGQAHPSNAFTEEASQPVFIFIDNTHFDVADSTLVEKQWLPSHSRILVTTTDCKKCGMHDFIDPYVYKMTPLKKEEAKNLILRHVFSKEKAGLEEATDEVIKLIDIDSDDELSRDIVIEGPDSNSKTSLSNAVLDYLDLSRYDVSRPQIEHSNLEPDIKILQQQIVRDLFHKDISLNTFMEDWACLSNAFKEKACRPVFIFIDNAHFDVADLLPVKKQWLPIHSRILVTTTDHTKCDIPNYIGQYVYKMKLLDKAEPKNFLGRENDLDIDLLTERFGRFPLALQMFASYLRQLDENIPAGRFISTKPPVTEPFVIYSWILDFIYKGLEDPYREAFLDIAIFFNNRERNLVTSIFPEIQLNVLEDSGLIKISDDDKLIVHGVVRKRAIQISGNDRIMDIKSFNDVRSNLSNQEKPTIVKGIWISEGELKAADLDKMHKSLRVLYLGKSTKVKGECENKFEDLRFFYQDDKDFQPVGFNNFTRVASFRGKLKQDDYFDELAKFQKILKPSGTSNLTTWPRYVGLVESLHVLNLRDSQDIGRLPEGLGCLFSLEELDLSNCVKLTELPESLCQLQCLYQLNLSGCSNLKKLGETFGNLSCLAELDCSDCLVLESLPNGFGSLNSLCRLQLRKCKQLDELPESFGNLSSLEYLDLSYSNGLSKLPSSFQKLSSLSVLLLACSGLTGLPENFGNLSSLKKLDLSGSSRLRSLGPRERELNKDEGRHDGGFGQLPKLCYQTFKGCYLNLKTFSDSLKHKSILSSRRTENLEGSFGQLQTLCYLSLKDSSNLESLPEEFARLSDLEELDLTGCNGFKRLPEHFGHFKCLRVLKLSCSKLVALPSDIGFMISLEQMILTNCQKLTRLPSGICELKSLSYLLMSGCSRLTKLPFGFDKLSCLQELEITDCGKLESLPDQPSALRVLRLRGCSQLNKIPESIGKLSKLEELVLTGCASLTSLPPSFSEINSLRHLRLRGAPNIRSSPENLPSSIETLDLGDCSMLRTPLQRRGHYSSLKLLFLDGCSTLSSLSKDFEQQKSLSYLSIAGCEKLEALPDHLENIVSLVAVDASGCPLLRGETMDRLAELHFLYFVDVRGSKLLIERWLERRELHHKLIVALESSEEAVYADTIISCLSQQATQVHRVLKKDEEAMRADTVISRVYRQRRKLHEFVKGLYARQVHSGLQKDEETAMFRDTAISRVYTQRRELHELVESLHRIEEAMYSDMVIACPSQQRRELHEHIEGLAMYEKGMYAGRLVSSTLYDQSSVPGKETFALIVTCCPDSQVLETAKRKCKELIDSGFRIIDTSEKCGKMKCPSLLCFALLRLLKKRLPETFAALKILHTWIVTLDVLAAEEGKRQIKNIKAILPALGEGDGDWEHVDLRAFTDIVGGVPRFFPPLLTVVADNFSEKHT